MKLLSFVMAITIGMLIFSCGSSRKEYEEKNRSEHAVAPTEAYDAVEPNTLNSKATSVEEQPRNALSSQAAVVNKKDSSRQFIRTADLKFKVNNVVEATYSIERLVAKYEGYVTYTNLHSDIIDIDACAISSDSIVETSTFKVVNEMSIRVPNFYLDTVLKSMAPLVDFLDYRVIKADDVALQLLANKLLQGRNGESADRLLQAVAQQRGKLNEVNAVEETIFERVAAADAAQIQNMAMRDKIQYSTVTIDLYQDNGIKRKLLCNDNNLGNYEPSLIIKLWHSLNFGWHWLEILLLFLIKFWPLGILGLVGYWAVKKFGK